MTENYVTVACVNFKTTWGDKQANLKKMMETVTQAAARGTDLIIFPELALSGYDCDDGCTMHREAAETIPGPCTEEMARVAAQHDIYVVFGMPEKDRDDPSRRYISSAVVGPEGVLGAYRKLHLAGPPLFTEWKCFSRGNALPVFKTAFGLIGVQICYDFWVFPELTRILVLKGARLIVNTTASPAGPSKPYFLVQQTGARATENRVFAASANLVGKEVKTTFYGHSAIAGPNPPKTINIYAQAGEGEEVISATLNMKALAWWRSLTTWEKDWRADIILTELNALKGGGRAG